MLLSEIFGVERDVDFKVIGYIGYFMIREWSDGTERIWWRLKDHQVYANSDLKVLYDVIFNAPANIIHLPPPLTDEQREQLRAFWTLGYKSLIKDKFGSVYAYEIKPCKKTLDTWLYEDGNLYICSTKPTKCLESLVSWSDPEPYDIGKALGVGE